MDWESFYNSFRKPGFIEGYEVQNRLGGGAFGDVYKARKISIGKAFAVKFLKVEDDAQREVVERELSQVRHFAAIDHPNLVTIEDLGSAMGVPYLIMGYAGEETLAKRLKQGPMEPAAALLTFVQTARGVLALHDRRLVHFDLKPSNVFLKGEVARVGDYGLSKLLTDGRTTLSFGRGTPQYMAPEMMQGRADHRADLYSLGIILFEMLTGDLPFEALDGGGLVMRTQDDPPKFPAGFPVRLRPVVEACLRLKPDDRPADVGEILAELDQTARPGDSVAIDWGEEPVLAPRSSEADATRPTPILPVRMPEPPRDDDAVGRGLLQEVADRVLGKGAGVGAAAEAQAAAILETGPAPRLGATVGRTATVPVPPRIQGGPALGVVATLRVAFEVLAALVGGLASGALRMFQTSVDPVVSSSGNVMQRGVRLSLFLMLMASLGFAVMLAGMVFLQAVE